MRGARSEGDDHAEGHVASKEDQGRDGKILKRAEEEEKEKN